MAGGWRGCFQREKTKMNMWKILHMLCYICDEETYIIIPWQHTGIQLVCISKLQKSMVFQSRTTIRIWSYE
jgi:hypothetical protein